MNFDSFISLWQIFFYLCPFLAKIKIDFNASNRHALFSLPDFSFPKHKNEAVAIWDVIKKSERFFIFVQKICYVDVIKNFDVGKFFHGVSEYQFYIFAVKK